MDIEKLTQKTIELGKLSLLFARTNRATLHEEGSTMESDTDHTVMLGLCACAIASSYAPHLDLGKIAQFAFVHDLVEAYAGDTPTLAVSNEVMKKKDEIEHKAFLQIESEFGEVFPWIHTTIQEYESLITEEAKFIKTLDKCMPKITQILNKGKQFENTDMTQEKLNAAHNIQLLELQNSYGKSHPVLMELLENLVLKTSQIIK